MKPVDEVEISKTILRTYSEKLLDYVASDVIIVGAGPSGLVAALFLAKAGVKVSVLEKRLSPGGGIWGGGMGMNVAVVQEEVVPMLDEMGIRCHSKQDNLYAVDAVELAAGPVLECTSGRRSRVQPPDGGRHLRAPESSDGCCRQPHHHRRRSPCRPDRVIRESCYRCDGP